MRLGGLDTIRVDVRIIAATNADLKQMTEEGRFREDLFYRLNVISLRLPPLRDRKDDIPLLARHFLQKYGDENRKSGLELTPSALDLLTEYDWPGNVRELENVVERAVVLTAGPRLGAELIPEHVRKTAAFSVPDASAFGRLAAFARTNGFIAERVSGEPTRAVVRPSPGSDVGRSSRTMFRGSRAASCRLFSGSITSYGGATTAVRSGTTSGA